VRTPRVVPVGNPGTAHGQRAAQRAAMQAAAAQAAHARMARGATAYGTPRTLAQYAQLAQGNSAQR
jgi:hypothetical protein